VARFILVVGGSGSGKSEYAENRVAETINTHEGRVVYLATGVVTDDEFAARVKKHRERRPLDWMTLEEPLELDQVLKNQLPSHARILLIDGVGTWVANFIMANEEQESKDIWQEFNRRMHALLQTCEYLPGQVILVGDETGMGLVPENACARLFRDLNGWANRKLAEASEEVIQVVCGIPVRLK